MTRRDGPMPGNAYVQGCEWYGDRRVVKVHLWAPYTEAFDSFGGYRWRVQKCVVCGSVNETGLRAQYDADDHEVIE